ncbi:MAG: permease, partial [Deltaproteobacteria bacterium]
MKTLTKSLVIHELPEPFARFLGDRIVITLILAFIAIATIDRVQAYQSFGFTLKSLLTIAPFFLLAIAFAGYAKATGVDGLIARAFSGKPVMTIATASLAGALSPFCSCGVIPLIAAMLVSGVPLGPVMAFCVSSPIMDPEMFILTAAGISLNFAIAKTIAAVGMGLMAGFTMLGLEKAGFLHNPLKMKDYCSGCGPIFNANAKVEVTWRFWRQPDGLQRFIEEARSTGWFLGKWLTLAFFLESLMVAYVSPEWIGALVGGESGFAIPLAAIVGIPSYLNGYAAIPLIANLLDMGMSPGAAMTFITSGAVSSIPA